MLLLFKLLISDIYVFTTSNYNYFLSKSLTARKTPIVEGDKLCKDKKKQPYLAENIFFSLFVLFFQMDTDFKS